MLSAILTATKVYYTAMWTSATRHLDGGFRPHRQSSNPCYHTSIVPLEAFP